MEKRCVFLLIQWMLLVIYVVMFIVAPFGSFTLDVYYFRAPDSGGSGPWQADIDFGLVWNILISVIALLEGLLLNIQRKWSFVLKVVLCIGRMIIPSGTILLALLFELLGESVFALTVYPYFLCIAAIVSLITYIYTSKQAVLIKA